MNDNFDPHKSEEYEKFIEFIEKGTEAHWSEIAEALGVNKDTIRDWKKTPRAIEAIKKGISYAISQMERAGKDDWRMWDRKLTRLGAQVIEKTDLTSDGEKIIPHIVLDTKPSE